jgi:hypothetical protein
MRCTTATRFIREQIHRGVRRPTQPPHPLAEHRLHFVRSHSFHKLQTKSSTTYAFRDPVSFIRFFETPSSSKSRGLKSGVLCECASFRQRLSVHCASAGCPYAQLVPSGAFSCTNSAHAPSDQTAQSQGSGSKRIFDSGREYRRISTPHPPRNTVMITPEVQILFLMIGGTS